MNGKLNRETLDNFRTESKALVRYLKNVIGKTSQQITDALNKEIGHLLKKEKKKNAIDRWYNDKINAPSKKEVAIIVEALRKMAGYPNNLTGEKMGTYGPPPKSEKVWVPFDMELPVADYNGVNPLLSFIQIEEKMGVVLYRNTSNKEADGEFFVGQAGMATQIDPSTKIAIRRINKALWKFGRYYIIMDTVKEVSICALHPGDDEETVKLVSPEGPHRVFPLKEILAIFTIVNGNYIPIPPINLTATSNSQQQDIPPIDPPEQ